MPYAACCKVSPLKKKENGQLPTLEEIYDKLTDIIAFINDDLDDMYVRREDEDDDEWD